MDKEKFLELIGKEINKSDSGDWVRKSTVYSIINHNMHGHVIVPENRTSFGIGRDREASEKPSRGWYVFPRSKGGTDYLYSDGVIRNGVNATCEAFAFWESEQAAKDFLQTHKGGDQSE